MKSYGSGHLVLPYRKEKIQMKQGGLPTFDGPVQLFWESKLVSCKLLNTVEIALENTENLVTVLVHAS